MFFSCTVVSMLHPDPICHPRLSEYFLSISILYLAHLWDFGNGPAHLPHMEPWLKTHSAPKGIDITHFPSIAPPHFHLKYFVDVLRSATLPLTGSAMLGVHYPNSKDN